MRAEPRKTDILTAPEVEAAINVSGEKTTKLYDGESLFLVCRNGRGFWRYQYRDPTTKKFASKGLAASAAPPIPKAAEGHGLCSRHAWLDSLTQERAFDFAARRGYDL